MSRWHTFHYQPRCYRPCTNVQRYFDPHRMRKYGHWSVWHRLTSELQVDALPRNAAFFQTDFNLLIKEELNAKRCCNSWLSCKGCLLNPITDTSVESEILPVPHQVSLCTIFTEAFDIDEVQYLISHHGETLGWWTIFRIWIPKKYVASPLLLTSFWLSKWSIDSHKFYFLQISNMSIRI